MISRRLTLIGLFVFMAAGCHAGTSMSETTDEELLQAGPNGLIRLKVDSALNTISLSTVSTGCTRAEHFSIRIDASGQYTAQRLKQDRCRRRPFVVTFDYALNELPD